MINHYNIYLHNYQKETLCVRKELTVANNLESKTVRQKKPSDITQSWTTLNVVYLTVSCNETFLMRKVYKNHHDGKDTYITVVVYNTTQTTFTM